MRKLMVALVAACTAGVAVADDFVPPEGSELREGEYHPDWASLSGNVTIPKGETWVAYEYDMDAVNNLTRLYVNGTFVMDNTTKWLTGDNKLWNYAGTVVKRGASVCHATGYSYRFCGTFIIEAGTLVQENHYVVGASGHAKLIVRDGATYQLDFACSNSDTKFYVSGNGVGGQGALVINQCSEGAIPYLVLDDDAYVVLNAGSPFSGFPQPTSGACLGCDPGTMDLQGHTLTIGGSAATVSFNKLNVTNSLNVAGGGALELLALASAAPRTLTIANSTAIDSSVIVKMPEDAVVKFQDYASAPQLATLVAAGDLKFTYAKSTYGTAAPQSANFNVWAGPIQLADGSTLTVDPADAARQINLTGPISGVANVQCGTSATAAKGVVLLSGANAYTGTTTVFGEPAFKLFLSQSASIPDFAKLTVSGGAVYPSIDYDAEGDLTWTADSVLALAQAQGSTTVTIDGTKAKALDDLTILPADIVKYFPNFGLTWDGYGTSGGYTLEGPYSVEKPLNLNVLAGTVRLSGEETINLGTVTVSGTSPTSSGTLVLDGAKDVVYADQTFTIGATAQLDAEPVARVIVTNSTLRSTYCPADFTSVEAGTLFVGRHEKGVLVVEDGAVISNKLFVGGGINHYQGAGIGAVYQRGGLVVPYCGTPAYYSSAIGNAGHGVYELSGGTFKPTGSLIMGGWRTGIFLQTGGEAVLPGTALQNGNGGTCFYAMLGGTGRVVGGDYTACMGNGGNIYFTVQGKGTVFSLDESHYKICYNCAAADKFQAFYNLNDDAVFELGGFFLYKTLEDYGGKTPLLVNFNGGVLKLCNNYSTPFACNSSHSPARVVVYEKGVQIDTSARTGNDASNYGGRFEAAASGGIQSIDLPEGGLPNCPVTPEVRISGEGGYGASAIALVDPDTSTVTNILVTSHGWGYPAGATTATLVYRDKNGSYWTQHTISAANITVADNDVGGFTKLGANTFTLDYTNTWAKWTRVLGGTLKAGCDKAIPSGTYLTLSNDATLDLNNVSDATFTGVDGTGGTVANGTLKIVGEWTVSAKKFIDRETTAVVGTLDLTECTGITLVDTEVLDDAAMALKRLDLFTATEVLGLEDVEISGAPKDWRFTKTPNGLRLAPPGKGLLMIIGSNSGSSPAARETVRYDGADVEIVVAANAPKTVKFAASELQNF